MDPGHPDLVDHHHHAVHPLNDEAGSGPPLSNSGGTNEQCEPQLEGLYMAMASINEALIAKGVLSREEVTHALRVAEQTVVGSDRATEDLRPAERDAMAFPCRLLIEALGTTSDGQPPTFSALARRVGAAKLRYNDQR